jgi:hypothetical protein
MRITEIEVGAIGLSSGEGQGLEFTAFEVGTDVMTW